MHCFSVRAIATVLLHFHKKRQKNKWIDNKGNERFMRISRRENVSTCGFFLNIIKLSNYMLVCTLVSWNYQRCCVSSRYQDDFFPAPYLLFHDWKLILVVGYSSHFRHDDDSFFKITLQLLGFFHVLYTLVCECPSAPLCVFFQFSTQAGIRTYWFLCVYVFLFFSE